MAHKFIVQTRKGRADSLKEKAKILFTITPVESKRSTCPYRPVEFKVMDFARDSDVKFEFNWQLKLGFNTYTATTKGDRTYHKLPGVAGSWVLRPGKYVTMSAANGGVAWSNPPRDMQATYTFGQPSVIVENRTGVAQSVVLQLYEPETTMYWSIAAYDVPGGDEVIAPVDLVVQAYVVDPSSIYTGSILGPEDLRQPLFNFPFHGESLPASSTWTLTQSIDGKLQLKPETRVELGGHSIETLAKSLSDMREQIALHSTQFNAEGLEKLVANEVAGLSHSLNELKTQMGVVQSSVKDIDDRHSRLDSRVLNVEEKTERLATVLERIERRMGVTEKSVGRVEATIAARETELMELERSGEETRKAVQSAQKTLGNVKSQLDSMNSKVPATGETTSELVKSFDQTKKELATIQNSIASTGTRVTDLDRRIATVEANAERMMELLDGSVETGGEILFP